MIAAVQNGPVIRLPIDLLFRAPGKVAEAVGLSRSSRNRAAASVAPDQPPTQKDEQTVAQKTTVQLVDDLDGSEAQETVSFAVDGTSYEIDLSGEHADALRDALAPYVGAARKAGGGASSNGRRSGGRRGSGSSGGGSTSSNDRERTAQIRQWAREQGMDVNERGRIPNKIVQAYEAAH